MDWTKWPSIGGLVIGTVCLSRNVQTTFAFDKPLLSSSLLLASTAVTTIGLSRFLPKDSGRTTKGGQQYDALPLEEVGQPHPSRQPSPNREDVRYPSSLRKLRTLFLILVASICLRVEILRHVLANTQCTVLTWEPLIPFVFVCWDYWTIQRHKRQPAAYDDPNASVYDALEQQLVGSPYRYLVSVGLLSFGGLIAVATTRPPPSTYICAASLHFHNLTPVMQRVGTLLDIIIGGCVSQLLYQKDAGRGQRGVALRVMSVGWALLFSAATLFTIGTVYYIAFATDLERRRILEIPGYYVWSLLKLDWWVCLTLVCAFLAILHVGLTTVSILSTFVSMCTVTTSYAWSNSLPFPAMYSGISFLAISLAILGFAAYFHIETAEERSHHSNQSHTGHGLFHRIPTWFYLILLLLFLARTGLWTWRTNTVNYHPIDMLMYEAETVHETYVNQSAVSKSLADAVKNYRERYKRHPPPGFDHWYNYATERNSAIIDDFDSIHDDLLPFYALPPQEIRRRTWQMVSNPWHDASGLSVRNGKVDISPNVMATHRWMLDGLVGMIKHFAEWLPDMDLAFNVNDECRIAVPYREIERMRIAGKQSGSLDQKPFNKFSVDREVQWPPVPKEPSQERKMREMSWQRTFYEFGSVGCPPGSPARDRRLWDVSRLCTSCSAPQSLGAYLANWTLAGDICHQPDLASLHGIYISPAAFKGSHDLYPIFSQSKVHGFNDILYPSAWNYIDKARYAPSDEFPDVPYANKNNSLFWRGATSEGVSPGKGQWKGMTRQRLIHLANDINGTGPAQTLLIPDSHQPNASHQRLSYSSVSIADMTRLVNTDVRVVRTKLEDPGSIARCGGEDCPQQAAEFAPIVMPTEFQAHWNYRYLLDLDGAGFSGRFLPFLQSRSLPFKAGIFREWWDDRVTAWQHFIPLDVRGHGLWATLTYFAGLEGKLNGRNVKLEAHESQGERVAENGRLWAEKVLRKEDMEIYFFRLLLEWGRLTDDARDSIGFDVDAG